MRIAFCKYAGLGNGGIEKYLQTIAIIYKKNGHDIDFYYTRAAKLTHTSWNHPDNDPQRIELLKSFGINLIEVNLSSRHYNDWLESDFYEKFDESKYDYIVTGGNGESEFPYNCLKNIKIIHTVHGEHVFNQNNIHKSVLLCNWQANRWIDNGGDKNKIEIIPSVVYVPTDWSKNFRKKYSIPDESFVYGFHQRNDDEISSTISLDSFSRIQNSNTFFAILGATNTHRRFVSERNISNVVFVEYTSSVDEIHEFIDGIDVYTHCRKDGEVCSASIIEAMSHSKPLISFPGINMGHSEQLQDCGKMSYSIEEYSDEMVRLQQKKYYDEMSHKVFLKYRNTYHFEIIENELLELIKL